jgi:hypothetical protein
LEWPKYYTYQNADHSCDPGIKLFSLKSFSKSHPLLAKCYY